MPTKNRVLLPIKSIPSWSIILGLTILGFILGLVLSQAEYLTASRRPTQLEPLPVAAAQFLAFDVDWLDVGLYVKTRDDQIYFNWQSYVNEWSSGTWQVSELSEGAIHPGDICGENIVKRFERTIGELSDCYTIDVPSEWCPGPIASFAIDRQGNVWQMAQPQLCFFTALFVVPIVTGIGLVAGIILVLLRWLITKIYRATGG